MTRTLHPFAALLLVAAHLWSGSLAAQEPATPEGATQPEARQAGDAAVESPSTEQRRRGRRVNDDDGAVVTFAGDASLPAGQSTGAVIAIIGSASSDGDVRESVVSLLGSTRVTGHVGESAVARFEGIGSLACRLVAAHR